MKKSKILAFILCLISVITIFAFAGCADNNTPSTGNGSDVNTGGTENNGGNNQGNGSGNGNNQGGSATVTQSNVLIAYFSLAENIDYDSGNTVTTGASMSATGDVKVLSDYISEYTGGEIFSIRTVKKYPNDFQAVVDENHAETQNPTLQTKLADINKYDIVFIGYPVWASNVPRAIRSFISDYDLSDKTVVPFCSHDGYGAGGSFTTIRTLSGATVLEGFAIRGTGVGNAPSEVVNWLERIGIQKPAVQTNIELVVGDITLTGVLNDTAVAKQFLSLMPQTMRLSRYAYREYYGSINGTISATGERKRTFSKGEISYCPTNNTFAVWFDKEEQTLGMDIIKIGEITSDFTALSSMPSSIELTVRVAQSERKILIAYFTLAENISLDGATINTGASISSSGNVSTLARHIQEYTEGEIFSIRTVNQYPNNYDDCLNAVVREKEQNARPQLKSTVNNMDEYDVVFLGYPNWSYTVPMAIYSFLEGYDFSGKTVVPFCSHGTGGLASTVSDIRSKIPDATVLNAMGVSRDNVGNCQSAIQNWLAGLGF